MGEIQNSRHERFAQELAAGNTAVFTIRARLTVEVLDELHWRIMPEIALSSVGA